MPPAVANEEVGSDLGTLGGGAPQTPARGLRPLLNGYSDLYVLV